MKHIGCFVGIVLVTFGLCLLAFYVETKVLNIKVLPPVGLLIEQWLDVFKRWSIAGVIVSGVASWLWYMSGQWSFIVDRWQKSGKRVIWLLFFVPSIIPIIMGVYFTRYARAGAWFGYLFYILNGSLCYYLATALFSPSSFKYTPWLAKEFWRQLW